MFDVRAARAQFPALDLTLEDGQPCTFLDNPAGTQVPRRVVDAVSGYYTHANANTDGAFLTSRRTDETIEAARVAMADLLGAPDPSCIVFGPNMTTLTFAFARSIARELTPGDEIVCTTLDHDANVAPWLALQEERGVRVVFADIDPADGTLDLADLARKIGPRTRVVAFTYCSNALGSVTDAAHITRLAHEAGALSWIDAVQYAPHGPIDVAALDCDFLACSSYKFFGPHIGIVYGKREHLDRLHPYKVRPSKDVAPYRWETGTQNHECLAGVTAAVDYLADLSLGDEPSTPTPAATASRRDRLLAAMARVQAYERTLAERLIGGLTEIDGTRIYGLIDPARFASRVPTVACTIDGHSPDDLATRLGKAGIFAWSGNYYALAVMERLGLQERGGALRIGPVHYNTVEEIDRTLDVLRTAVETRPRAHAVSV